MGFEPDTTGLQVKAIFHWDPFTIQYISLTIICLKVKKKTMFSKSINPNKKQPTTPNLEEPENDQLHELIILTLKIQTF